MALESPLFHVPRFVAGENLSDAQFTFVKINSSDPDEVVQCDSADDIPIGILQNSPDSGEQCTIMVAGISKVEVGGDGFSAGDEVVLRDDGTVEEADTSNDPASGDTIVGQGYLDGSDGAISSILFNCLVTKEL